MNAAELTTALKAASEAHHAYEQANFPKGETDPNWAAWYAQWIVENYKK